MIAGLTGASCLHSSSPYPLPELQSRLTEAVCPWGLRYSATLQTPRAHCLDGEVTSSGREAIHHRTVISAVIRIYNEHKMLRRLPYSLR